MADTKHNTNSVQCTDFVEFHGHCCVSSEHIECKTLLVLKTQQQDNVIIMINQSSMPLTRILSQISRARILPAVCASSLPHISTITNRQSAHMPDGVVIAACSTTQDIYHARMPCRLNTQSSPGLCVFRLFSCSRAFTVMEPALNAIDLNPGPQFDWLTNIAIICFHTMPNPVTSNCCQHTAAELTECS